jgi:hypothetical protein
MKFKNLYLTGTSLVLMLAPLSEVVLLAALRLLSKEFNNKKVNETDLWQMVRICAGPGPDP